MYSGAWSEGLCWRRLFGSFQIPGMEMKSTMPILVFLIIYTTHVSGVGALKLDSLQLNILDGEIIAYWKHPVDAPANSQYNVQMGKYGGEYAKVDGCTGITNTYCDLSSLIPDYRARYNIRVQLIAGDYVSEWAKKRFLPNTSELRPPSFSLWATSSTLTVYVHQKPILKELFPYGVTYTIYLEERGQDNKTTTAYMRDDMEEDQRTKIFTSLRWRREYCISIMVEGIGSLAKSSVSPKHCMLLPEQEWFIVAVSSLSILGVLVIIVIMAALLMCHLKRPAKTPKALKAPVTGWLPLSVGEGTVEVVTDKGWFLSNYRPELENCVKDPMPHVTVIEDSEEEDRRTSMDSGVSMESNSLTNKGGSPPMRQEDSGCGSMGGPESSNGSRTDFHLQDDGTDTGTVQKRADSGVGTGCQPDSSSTNLDGQDRGPLVGSVAGGNYRRQSPSAVQIHVCDDEDTFKEIPPGSVLAEVITGYRAGPQTCICSGAGQCTWCHKQGHRGTEDIKQYGGVCIENGLLGSKCDLVNSYKRQVILSDYATRTQPDAITMNDLETFLQLGETFPLLTTLSSLPPVKCGQGFNTNNVSLSLCDVQLETD